MLATWIAKTERSDRPATPQEFAVAIEPLFAFARSFGLQCDPEEATAAYREALAGLPAGVIAAAVTAARSTWSNGYRLPLPAELRKLVPSAYWVIRSELAKARTALAALDAGRVEAADEPLSLEDRRKLMAAASSNLKAVPKS